MHEREPVPATVFLRPLGSPAALGFAGLAGGSLVAAGLELGWIAGAERHQVALILIAFTFPLQLTAAILSFLARDGAAGTALGILSGTWLGTGLVWIGSAPGSVSGALGLMLLVAAALLAASATAAGMGKLLPAAVFTVASVRFGLVGVHELGGAEGWKDAAGVTGLVVVALAGYGVLALTLEDAAGRTVLPVGRRGAGADAISGSFAQQAEAARNDAGVRNQL